MKTEESCSGCAFRYFIFRDENMKIRRTLNPLEHQQQDSSFDEDPDILHTYDSQAAIQMSRVRSSHQRQLLRTVFPGPDRGELAASVAAAQPPRGAAAPPPTTIHNRNVISLDIVSTQQPHSNSPPPMMNKGTTPHVAGNFQFSFSLMSAIVIAVLLVALVVPVNILASRCIFGVWSDSVLLQTEHSAIGTMESILEANIVSQEHAMQRIGMWLRIAEVWCRPEYRTPSGSSGEWIPAFGPSVQCEDVSGVVLPLLPWATNMSYMTQRHTSILKLRGAAPSQQTGGAPKVTIAEWIAAHNETGLIDMPLDTFVSSSGLRLKNYTNTLSFRMVLLQSIHDSDWVAPLMVELMTTLSCANPGLPNDSAVSADVLFPSGFYLSVWCQRKISSSGVVGTTEDWIGVTTITPLTTQAPPSPDVRVGGGAAPADALVREILMPRKYVSKYLLPWLQVAQVRPFYETETVHDAAVQLVSTMESLIHQTNGTASIAFYPCGTVSDPDAARNESTAMPSSSIGCRWVNQSAVYRAVTDSDQFSVETTYPLGARPGGFAAQDLRIGDGRTYWWHRTVVAEGASTVGHQPPPPVHLTSGCKYVVVSAVHQFERLGTNTSRSHKVVICLELTAPRCVAEAMEAAGSTTFAFQVPQDAFSIVALVNRHGDLVDFHGWDLGQRMPTPSNTTTSVAPREEARCFTVQDRRRLALKNDTIHPPDINNSSSSSAARTIRVVTSVYLDHITTGQHDVEGNRPFNASSFVRVIKQLAASRGWSDEVGQKILYQLESVLSAVAAGDSTVLSDATLVRSHAFAIQEDRDRSNVVAVLVSFSVPLNTAVVVVLENSVGGERFSSIALRYVGYWQAGLMVIIVAVCYFVSQWLMRPLHHIKAKLKKRTSEVAAVAHARRATPSYHEHSSEGSGSERDAAASLAFQANASPLSGSHGFVKEFSTFIVAYAKLRNLSREKVQQLRSAVPVAPSAAVRPPSLWEGVNALSLPSEKDDGDDPYRFVQLHRGKKWGVGRGVKENSVDAQSASDEFSPPEHQRPDQPFLDQVSHLDEDPVAVGKAKDRLIRDDAADSPTVPLAPSSLPCCALEKCSDVVIMNIYFPHCRLSMFQADLPWLNTSSHHQAFGGFGGAKPAHAGGCSSSTQLLSLQRSLSASSTAQLPLPGRPPSIGPFEYIGVVLRVISQHYGVVERLPSHQHLVVSFGELATKSRGQHCRAAACCGPLEEPERTHDHGGGEQCAADQALHCATAIVQTLHDMFFNASHEWVEAQAVRLVPPTTTSQKQTRPIVSITLDLSTIFLGSVVIPGATVRDVSSVSNPGTRVSQRHHHKLRPSPSPRSSINNSYMTGVSGSGNWSASLPNPQQLASHNSSVKQLSATAPPAPTTIEHYLVGDAMDRADALKQLQLVRHPRCTIICTHHFSKMLKQAERQLIPIDVMSAYLSTSGIPRTDRVVIFNVADPLCVAVGEGKTFCMKREPRAAGDVQARVQAIFSPMVPVREASAASGVDVSGGPQQVSSLQDVLQCVLVGRSSCAGAAFGDDPSIPIPPSPSHNNHRNLPIITGKRPLYHRSSLVKYVLSNYLTPPPSESSPPPLPLFVYDVADQVLSHLTMHTTYGGVGGGEEAHAAGGIKLSSATHQGLSLLSPTATVAKERGGVGSVSFTAEGSSLHISIPSTPTASLTALGRAGGGGVGSALGAVSTHINIISPLEQRDPGTPLVPLPSATTGSPDDYAASVKKVWENLEALPVEALQSW